MGEHVCLSTHVRRLFPAQGHQHGPESRMPFFWPGSEEEEEETASRDGKAPPRWPWRCFALLGEHLLSGPVWGQPDVASHSSCARVFDLCGGRRCASGLLGSEWWALGFGCDQAAHGMSCWGLLAPFVDCSFEGMSQHATSFRGGWWGARLFPWLQQQEGGHSEEFRTRCVRQGGTQSTECGLFSFPSIRSSDVGICPVMSDKQSWTLCPEGDLGVFHCPFQTLPCVTRARQHLVVTLTRGQLGGDPGQPESPWMRTVGRSLLRCGGIILWYISLVSGSVLGCVLATYKGAGLTPVRSLRHERLAPDADLFQPWILLGVSSSST